MNNLRNVAQPPSLVVSLFHDLLQKRQITFVSCSTLHSLLKFTMEKAIILAISIFAILTSAYSLEVDGWTWSKQMDNDGKYKLRTYVDLVSESVTFLVNLTIPPEENQWIGLGLSPNKENKNADLVIGLNTPDPDLEFEDFHTTADGQFVKDEDIPGDQIDWNRLYFNRTDAFSLFSVNRAFKVNNATEDMEIKNENLYLTWAYGIQNETNSPENATWRHFEINFIRPITSSSTINLSPFMFLMAVVFLASITNIINY